MKIEKLNFSEEEIDTLHMALLEYVGSVSDSWNYITPVELNEQGIDKYFILDIRKLEDFKKGHIKNAVNVFWIDLLKDKNLEKLPKNKTIVIVCYVGHTASQMLVALRLLGYKAIALKFGMGISPVEGVPVAGWVDFGFEIVK